jgi:hypothetical protein
VFDEKKVEADEQQKPVGGLAFFLSLFLLSPSSVVLLLFAFSYTTLDNAHLLALLLIATLTGAVAARVLIKRHISVLLHESKHSLVSNLVGNKRKRMHIDEHSGFFEYSFTKETAHFNFLIALAPYIVPVFTSLCSIGLLAGGLKERWQAIVLLGLGYGADLLLNLRDVSPIQTDISLIRGGYSFGLTYIAAWNLTIFALVIAWTLDGGNGLTHLLRDIAAIFLNLHPAAPNTSFLISSSATV